MLLIETLEPDEQLVAKTASLFTVPFCFYELAAVYPRTLSLQNLEIIINILVERDLLEVCGPPTPDELDEKELLAVIQAYNEMERCRSSDEYDTASLDKMEATSEPGLLSSYQVPFHGSTNLADSDCSRQPHRRKRYTRLSARINSGRFGSYGGSLSDEKIEAQPPARKSKSGPNNWGKQNLNSLTLRAVPTLLKPLASMTAAAETARLLETKINSGAGVLASLIGSVKDPRDEPVNAVTGRRKMINQPSESSNAPFSEPAGLISDDADSERSVEDLGRKAFKRISDDESDTIEIFGVQADGTPVFYRFASTAFQHVSSFFTKYMFSQVLADLLPTEERNHIAHLARLVVAIRNYHGLAFLLEQVNERQQAAKFRT